MRYDTNKDGIIQDNELLNAIMDWLDGKLGDETLLDIIMKWLNESNLQLPENWEQKIVSGREIWEKTKVKMIKCDNRYYTIRPEILINELRGVSFEGLDGLTAAIIAMGIWHKNKDLAKTACFIARRHSKWLNACYDGESLWLIDPVERTFKELKIADGVFIIG